MRNPMAGVQVDSNIDAELLEIGERYEDNIDEQHKALAQRLSKLPHTTWLRRLLGILFPLSDSSRKHYS